MSPKAINHNHKIRLYTIEKRLMEAELILDGLFTHDNFFHCMNPIHSKRIGLALGSVRSARNILRNDMNDRQLTLSTRSKQFNRGGVGWYYNSKKGQTWKCDCKKPFQKKGIWKREGKVKQTDKDDMQKTLLTL